MRVNKDLLYMQLEDAIAGLEQVSLGQKDIGFLWSVIGDIAAIIEHTQHNLPDFDESFTEVTTSDGSNVVVLDNYKNKMN